MAIWKRHRFRNISEMIDGLNGAVISKADISRGLDADGLTLIVNVGGAGDRTVTFAPALSRPWTAEEIWTEIKDTHADLLSTTFLETKGARGDYAAGGRRAPTYLKFVGTNGEVITVRSTGTANALFGFPTGASPANDTVGEPFTNTEVLRIQPKGDSQGIWDVVTYK